MVWTASNNVTRLGSWSREIQKHCAVKRRAGLDLSEHGNAAASLHKLTDVDPKNVAASQLLRETKVEMRRHAVKEKRMHRALFEQLEHDERSVEETAG